MTIRSRSQATLVGHELVPHHPKTKKNGLNGYSRMSGGPLPNAQWPASLRSISCPSFRGRIKGKGGSPWTWCNGLVQWRLIKRLVGGRSGP